MDAYRAAQPTHYLWAALITRIDEVSPAGVSDGQWTDAADRVHCREYADQAGLGSGGATRARLWRGSVRQLLKGQNDDSDSLAAG